MRGAESSTEQLGSDGGRRWLCPASAPRRGREITPKSHLRSTQHPSTHPEPTSWGRAAAWGGGNECWERGIARERGKAGGRASPPCHNAHPRLKEPSELPCTPQQNINPTLLHPHGRQGKQGALRKGPSPHHQPHLGQNNTPNPTVSVQKPQKPLSSLRKPWARQGMQPHGETHAAPQPPPTHRDFAPLQTIKAHF